MGWSSAPGKLNTIPLTCRASLSVVRFLFLSKEIEKESGLVTTHRVILGYFPIYWADVLFINVYSTSWYQIMIEYFPNIHSTFNTEPWWSGPDQRDSLLNTFWPRLNAHQLVTIFECFSQVKCSSQSWSVALLRWSATKQIIRRSTLVVFAWKCCSTSSSQDSLKTLISHSLEKNMPRLMSR